MSIYNTAKSVGGAIGKVVSGGDTEKKKQISDAVYYNLLQKSSDKESYLSNLDGYFNNKNTQEELITQKIRSQENRVGFADNINTNRFADSPKSVGRLKAVTGFVLAAAVPLIEQSIFNFATIEAMKSRDLQKQAQLNSTKERIDSTTGLIGAMIAGATTGAAAGTVVPGLGNIVGAIGGALVGAVINRVSFSMDQDHKNQVESFKISQENRSSEIDNMLRGDINSNGNRGGAK